MSGLALGLTSLAVGVATTGASFGQAGAQRRKRDAAQKAAQRAFKDARKRLDVNYMEDLGINKGIYDIARDRSMVQAAGLMESAREGSARGVASTAGQVYQQDLLGQQQVRAAQEGEMNRIEGLIAGEDARLAGLQAQLSLDKAAGAQQAARDAESARVSAIGEGIEGAIGSVGQAVSMGALYGEGGAGKRKESTASVTDSGIAGEIFGTNQVPSYLLAGTPAISANMGPSLNTPATSLASTTTTVPLNTLASVDDMSKREYKKFERGLNPSVLRQIRGTDEYTDTMQSLRAAPNFSSSPYIFNMGGVSAAQGSATGGVSPEIMQLIIQYLASQNKNQ